MRENGLAKLSQTNNFKIVLLTLVLNVALTSAVCVIIIHCLAD